MRTVTHEVTSIEWSINRDLKYVYDSCSLGYRENEANRNFTKDE